MIEKVILIPKEDLDRYDRLLDADQIDYHEIGISRYSVVESWSADFGNGYTAQIKICSSDDDEPLWCEGVLFLDGNECCCTEPSYTLSGECWFDYNGNQFSILVKAV